MGFYLARRNATRPTSVHSTRTIPRPGVGTTVVPETAIGPPLIDIPLGPADEVDPPILPPVLPANPAFVPPGRYFPPQGVVPPAPPVPPQGSIRGSIPDRSAHPIRARLSSNGSDTREGNESPEKDRTPRRRGGARLTFLSSPNKCSCELIP